MAEVAELELVAGAVAVAGAVLSVATNIIKNVHVDVEKTKVVISFSSLEGIIDLERNTITLDFQHIPIITQPIPSRKSIVGCFRSIFSRCSRCFRCCCGCCRCCSKKNG